VLVAIPAVDGVDSGDYSGNFFRDQLTQDNSPQGRKNGNCPGRKMVLVAGDGLAPPNAIATWNDHKNLNF
jgi:hypothetical protein